MYSFAAGGRCHRGLSVPTGAGHDLKSPAGEDGVHEDPAPSLPSAHTRAGRQRGSGARREVKARMTRPAVALLNSAGIVDLAALPQRERKSASSARDAFGGRMKTEQVSHPRSEATAP